MNGPLESWLSVQLLAMTTQLVPTRQRAWSDAMRAEMSYLPSGARLRWAFGCLLAAIKLRLFDMKTGTFRTHRWVMLFETLGFLPLALGWLDVTFGQSGVIRLTPKMVIDAYSAFPGYAYSMSMWLLASVVGLAGPIGMFLGLRYLVRGRGLGNPVFGWLLIAMLVAYGMTAVVAVVFTGPGAFKFDWKAFLLFGLLPSAVIWHLMYLAKPESRSPLDARLAAA